MRSSPQALIEAFDVTDIPELPLRYNVAPTQLVPMVREEEGTRRLVLARWGLIPSWASDPKIGNSLINARAETASVKPAFRSAFRQRRCLIPADGFYEWQKLGKAKQPFLIHRPDHKPFAFAGLWERWRRPEGGVLDSCTILTTEANGLMRPLHDRMPVILAPIDYDRWLDSGMQDVASLLRPCPDDVLTADPVTSRVNNPRNEGPECIAPLNPA